MIVRDWLLGIAALAACGSTQASAHWQYTRWGMTRAQVLAVAPVGSKVYVDSRLDTPGSRISLLAPYSADGLSLTAAFGFGDDGRLNRIALLLADVAKCGSLRAAMRDSYGWPDHDVDLGSAFATEDWRDTVAGNKVMFVRHGSADRPSACFVSYAPLPTGL